MVYKTDYYWSGFPVFGKTGPVRFERTTGFHPIKIEIFKFWKLKFWKVQNTENQENQTINCKNWLENQKKRPFLFRKWLLFVNRWNRTINRLNRVVNWKSIGFLSNLVQIKILIFFWFMDRFSSFSKNRKSGEEWFPQLNRFYIAKVDDMQVIYWNPNLHW